MELLSQVGEQAASITGLELVIFMMAFLVTILLSGVAIGFFMKIVDSVRSMGKNRALAR